MLKLEEITKDAQVAGLVPDQIVKLINVEEIDTNARLVPYRISLPGWPPCPTRQNPSTSWLITSTHGASIKNGLKTPGPTTNSSLRGMLWLPPLCKQGPAAARWHWMNKERS
ncbi:MAG TPA: hypothetical protein PKV17_01140 [Aquabacterium sp.]|nr:hypothetical protein [Aquabacterium sp.]HRH27368.1 hypothetical protein [Aquabacterium sp.]